MKKFFTIILAGIAASTVALSGCGKERSALGKTYYYVMNTDADLVVYDYFKSDKKAVEKMASLVDDVGWLLYDLNNSLSATVETSYVSLFNAAEAGERVEIDEYTRDVLSLALDVYELTDCYYNPAVYYGVQAFGFNGSKNKPSTADELPSKADTDKYAELASHFGELRLETENGKFYAVKPDYVVTVGEETLSLKLDLGGIAKGYAVDLIDGLISDYGFEYGYINFGSSSMAVKKYSEEVENYEIAFRDPRGNARETYVGVPLSDAKVSTSGDYENYFEIDSVRYSHVFDPFTARPIDTGIMSASVIGDSAAKADAMTTAIMAMGTQKAIEFIAEKLADQKVVFTFVTDEGAKYFYTNMTEGFTVRAEDYAPYAVS